jgi:hypothetical protein
MAKPKRKAAPTPRDRLLMGVAVLVVLAAVALITLGS